jgi:hypothetical protein
MILTLALLLYALKGNVISQSLESFQDKYINSFCSKETNEIIICENDEDVFLTNRAYSRAEFKDQKLTRLDYVMNTGEKAARKISVMLIKQYGQPTSQTDLLDSFSQTWQNDMTELQLSYSSKEANNLGHPLIRIYISEVKTNQ